jgi:superfamily II DNA or RNA helicase
MIFSSWSQLEKYFPNIKYISNQEKNNIIQFRYYQLLAVIAWLLSGCRGVIRLATGAGKTYTAAALVSVMLPKKTLILIHGRQLLLQTLEVFQNIFEPKLKENEHIFEPKMVGLVFGSNFDPGIITLASVDTVSFYLRSLSSTNKMSKELHSERQKIIKNFLQNEVDCLIYDECHHVGSADSWKEISDICNAYYRAGLSGTPLKHNLLNDMLLIGAVGPVVFDLNSSWLQKNEYLASATLLIKTQDWATKDSRGLNYAIARKKLLTNNKRRWSSIAGDIAEFLKEKNNRILVLTGNSVDLAKGIGQELEIICPKKDWDVVTGNMAVGVVKHSFNKLRAGKLRCLITTKLADEGIDVPDVNLLLIVGGGKSYVPTVQRIGRGLRKKKNNEELVVIDYFITGNSFLEKHDKNRLKTYSEEDCFSTIKIE